VADSADEFAVYITTARVKLLSDVQKFCNYFESDGIFIAFAYSLTVVHELTQDSGS